MSGKAVCECCDAAYVALRRHQDEIALLDQQIGDGDHVYNMLRGLEALQSMRADLEETDLGLALRLAANKVLSTVGGSSGPLLASLLMGMSRMAVTGGTAMEASEMYTAGVEAMRQRGRTGVGSKTMMDVLIPVAEKFRELARNQASLSEILETLPLVAERGMLATRDMVATKGRASFLGERSKGHVDPGARSSQVIITAVCELLASSYCRETSHEEIH